jgi:putative DNA methylase
MTSEYPIKSPRKLIEVALPLDAINVAAAREKSVRHGHPSTLHLWWARRLAIRDLMNELRECGMQTGGPASFSNRDKQAFACAFEALMNRIKKQSVL